MSKVFCNKGRNINGETIQVIAETKIVVVNIGDDTAQSPNSRPLLDDTVVVGLKKSVGVLA